MQITILNLNDNGMSTKKSGFWKRQFQVETTPQQQTFDALFGIILPAACFLFDPIVFRTNGYGEPLGGAFKPFAYVLSFVSIMSLLAFMLWGKNLKWVNGFLTGLFAVGAIISLTIGIVLFPFSLLGLTVLIGALGFTPLFTALVYWRNAVRAYKTGLPELGVQLLTRMLVLAGMFAVILPALLNVKIQKGLETMQTGDPGEIRRTARQLKYVAPLVDFSRLHTNYDSVGKRSESEENQALAESYEMLTGKSFAPYDSF